MAMSVWELSPMVMISMVSFGSRILRRISAVLKIRVSTKPSLEPRMTLSFSGSDTPLAGYVRQSMARQRSYPSMKTQVIPLNSRVMTESSVSSRSTSP